MASASGESLSLDVLNHQLTVAVKQQNELANQHRHLNMALKEKQSFLEDLRRKRSLCEAGKIYTTDFTNLSHERIMTEADVLSKKQHRRAKEKYFADRIRKLEDHLMQLNKLIAEEIAKAVSEHTVKITSLECEISEITALLTRVNSDFSALAVKIETLRSEIALTEKTNLETSIIPKYREYAVEHEIAYDVDYIESLIIACNEHHQENLLSSHFSEGSCPCPEDDNEDNCSGWYTFEKRCQCGGYKGFRWNDDDVDFSDITEFNIMHTEPAGFRERMW